MGIYRNEEATFSYTLTRAELADVVEVFVTQTVVEIEKVLAFAQSKFEAKTVAELPFTIVTVGGSSRYYFNHLSMNKYFCSNLF